MSKHQIHKAASLWDSKIVRPAIVEAIKGLAGEGSGRRWRDIAVLDR